MISVVIPTYNRRETLESTIRSLERQSLPLGKFEVVVVDDGSIDGTSEWLKNYNGRINLRFRRHPKNIGTAAARNDGVKETRGDIIVFLDDDIKPDKGLLATYFKAFEEGDQVFIGNVIYEKNPEERSLLRYLSSRGVHKGKRDFTCFITQNVSLKRKDAIEAGLFDDTIPGFFQGEDIEFGYKLSLLGKRFIYLPRALAYHSHTINLRKVLSDAERFGESLLPLLIKKHPVFRRTFRLYILDKIRLFKEPVTHSLYKVLARVSLNKFLYKTIKTMASVFNGYYVPTVFFDYLIFYNRTKWIRSNRSL